MNIKIRSLYDLKTFRVFQKYMLKKIFILAYICGIILLTIGVILAFISRGSYLVYLLTGILLPILMHVFYKLLETETINKNIYLRDTTVQIFSFDDEGFELEQISKVDSFRDKYSYKDIFSIIKYKRYYFIYINRAQAFVINNLDYILGNEEELDELFKRVKQDRFIIKRNSKKK